MRADYLFYLVSIVIINAFHIAVYLGILASIPHYIVLWYSFVQLVLCLVLMYRYHPFKEKFEYNQFDATLIFGTACILLSNILSVPFLLGFIDPLKKVILQKEFMKWMN